MVMGGVWGVSNQQEVGSADGQLSAKGPFHL